MTSSTSASSTPRMIVAFDCLRKPPELVQAGRPELLVEQGVDEGPGVLVVDDGDDELHARSIGAASDRGQRRSSVGRDRGGVYDAASDEPDRVQESPVSTDGPSQRPPRFARRARSRRSPRGGDLDAALDGILAAAVAASAPSMGAIFVSGSRPAGLQLVGVARAWTTRPTARLAAEVADPADPFARGRDHAGRDLRPRGDDGRRRRPSSAPTCR